MPNPPATIPPEGSFTSTGIGTDPDVWASGVLVLGSGFTKWLSYAEHVEFLASIREENFKMIFDFWNGAGWWLIGGVGIAWFINRYSKKGTPHEKRPTWGLVGSCALIAFIFGSLITVQSAGGFPRVLLSTTSAVTQPGPNGEMTILDPCRAVLDMTPLMSFKKDFRLALACNVVDPTTDPLSDKNIWVSNFFEITPNQQEIIAGGSPSGDFLKHGTAFTVNRYPILVPRDVQWEKITTLGDFMRMGGKILDPRYYR